MQKGKQFAILIGVALTLGLTGCGGNDANGANRPGKPTVRFFNASPDTPSLEIRLNDRVEASSLASGSTTPDFKAFDADDWDVSIKPTGAAEDAWAEVATLDNGNDYLIGAFGLSNHGGELAKRLRVTGQRIDRSVPNGNKSRLYILNAFNRAAGSDNIALDFKNPGQNPQFAVLNIPFGGFSALTTDSGPQTFEMRFAGAEEVFAARTMDLAPGKIYLIVLGGIEGSQGASLPEIRLTELQTR